MTRAEAERAIAPATTPAPSSEVRAAAPRQLVRVRPTRGAFTSLPTFDAADGSSAGGCGCGSGSCGC